MTGSPWLTRQQAAAYLQVSLPHVRLHSMRHTSVATMIDASGGDVAAVSKVLGHSTLSITLDLYGREADEARRRAAGYMDKATGRKIVGK